MLQLMKMSQAVQYVEQGHVRVGPDPINDPAFLVTRWVTFNWQGEANSSKILSNRHMEDFVTWVDTSKLKRTVMRYNVGIFL